MSQPIQISPFQRRVLAVPETFDIFLGGGRGGSKSYALALLALRHVEQYGAKARVLYLRRSHKGCADFVSLCLDLMGPVYGVALRFNAQEGLFRFPNGGTVEINQLENASDYQKFQGRSFTLLMIDEAGQFPTPELIDRLRSNLRGPKDLPLRAVLAANPGDVGHQWIAARYVFKSAPWVPFVEPHSERTFLSAPSTFLDNPFIDQAAYKRQLGASCPSDPELLRAWLKGDWSIARGAYFAAVLEESRNAVPRWDAVPVTHGRKWDNTFLAHDFGSSATSVTYLIAESPGGTVQGKYYPRGSLVLIDELATNEPGSLTKGMGYTVPVLAERIREMCARWKVTPEGVADDACFARTGHADSIAGAFRSAGVFFSPAKKADRLTGWSIMRRLLQDAGKPDVPGLYIARHCEYFWATVPYLGRDPRRVEDLDSRGPDHAADAVRYGCCRQRQSVRLVTLSGTP